MKKIIGILLSSIIFSFASFGQVSIALPEIDKLINVEGNGPYQRILEDAATRAGLKYSSVVFPKKRALHHFLERKDFDCLFTFTQTLRDKLGSSSILASYPFGAYKGFIFTPKSSKPLSLNSDLKNLTVGGVTGFEGTYLSLQNKGVKISLYPSEEMIFKMLETKRLDAVLAFLPDSQGRISMLNWDAQQPFFQSYDRLNCRNTTVGQEFLTKLSHELKIMHKNGRIKKLLGSAYLPITGDFSLEK